jgi:hypothetical protein
LTPEKRGVGNNDDGKKGDDEKIVEGCVWLSAVMGVQEG